MLQQEGAVDKVFPEHPYDNRQVMPSSRLVAQFQLLPSLNMSHIFSFLWIQGTGVFSQFSEAHWKLQVKALLHH